MSSPEPVLSNEENRVLVEFTAQGHRNRITEIEENRVRLEIWHPVPWDDPLAPPNDVLEMEWINFLSIVLVLSRESKRLLSIFDSRKCLEIARNSEDNVQAEAQISDILMRWAES